MANWLVKRIFSGNVLIKRLRRTVLGFNLFFVIAGLVVLSVGIFTLAEYHPYKESLGHHLWLHAIGLIVVGSATFLLAFLCFFGKIRRNPCLLLYFLMVLNVIYLTEILSGIAVIIEKSNLNATLSENLNETFNHIESNGDIWRHLQIEMKCCGINGANDWLQNRRSIPISCCDNPSKGQMTCTKEAAWKIGCKSPLLKYFEWMAAISASFSITFGFIQVIVIGFAYYLYKMFRKNCGEHIEHFLR